MSEDSRTVEIAGMSFEACGSGDVLIGVPGPPPVSDAPLPPVLLDGMTRADLPLHRWSPSPSSNDGPMFVPEEPIIFVGTTRHGLHTVLIGVKETGSGPTGLGLMSWTDEGNAVSVHYHWPTRTNRPSFNWSFEEGNPVECVMRWFPIPPETAHVDCTVDGKTIAATVRPVSRVVVVPLPPGTEHGLVDALAYDASGAPILRGRP